MSYPQSPWSLSDLFPAQNSPEMQAAFDELEAQVVIFEGVRPELTDGITHAAFLEIVRRLEAIEELGNRVSGFAALAFAADTQDQAAQTFLVGVEQRLTSLKNRLLFFELWWKALDDTEANRLMSYAGDYRYWLEEMRHFKPHTLTEPEEKIVNLKNVTGVSALIRLYDMITNRYIFSLPVDGKVRELTRGELMSYVRQPNPDLRAAAYQVLYQVYGQDGSILGQIYQSLVRDWRNENLDLRHFASPLAARNLYNDIPDDVVDTLLKVCQSNAPLFQRFFRLKARWLGMERLRRYDIYAPVAASDKVYPFGDAAEMVLESFQHFDSHLAQLARQVLEQKHLDSEVRRGKRSGAFCSTPTPRLTPWVLVNYQGRPEDIATLAHELGHAIHSLLASHHSLFTCHASLPLAENASTFAEMMLVDRLLAEEQDETVRRAMLFRQVDDAYATIMRQAQFAIFERQAHEMVQSGASVSRLADAYMENLRTQFNDTVEIGEEFRWEWVSIPHFYHTPFYVYAYSFGQLLVLSLYQQYKLEGEAFKPRYLKILSAGGSQSPVSILAEAGIDIHAASFWQGGFDVIQRLVETLEAIPLSS